MGPVMVFHTNKGNMKIIVIVDNFFKPTEVTPHIVDNSQEAYKGRTKNNFARRGTPNYLKSEGRLVFFDEITELIRQEYHKIFHFTIIHRQTQNK